VPTFQSITEKLGRAQKDFLSAADAVPAEQWKMSPGEGRWSAAELVCHVMTVERAVLRGADKLLQNPPQSLPFFKRFHVPMALVESRLIRRKTPLAVDASLLHEKEEMLGELREVRERTLAFIEETRGRDLSKYRQSHPFLGSLNAYEWFQFIASHEIRHTKQMREIATALPKTVASLQK
jgi:uncharacterized damage-inducible protein DinB